HAQPITLSPHHPRKELRLATYVLVPGAWLGGWVWREVAARLRAAGHDVYPITLTGLGERSHLARPEIDLETHITDVVNVMTWNDLDDVILVGHSYAGIVVTGVADRAPERIGQLVFLDAAPFADGMAMTDLYAPEALAALQRTVDEAGDGWRWPFPSFEELAEDASLNGLDDADRNLMEAKAVAQPWGTYTQPLRLHNDSESSYQRVSIACDDMRRLVAAGVPQIVALTAPPWRYLELETGHWPMLSAPVELAEMLDGLVRAGEGER
ncbi:MAG: alpha/beta fold hydrolase, partial [Thermomicrobiales bacterium]